MIRALAAFIVTVFIINPLEADTVFMRDGRRFDGTIVSQNRTQVVILVGGVRHTLQKAEMMRLVFDDGRRESELKKQEEEAARAEALRREQEVRAQQERERREAQARAAAEQARQDALRKESEKKAEADRQKEEAARRDREVRDAQDARTNTSGALFRAALVPGWGHFYQGRPGEAAVYGLGFAGTIGIISAAAHSARKAQSAYDTHVRNSFLFLITPGRTAQLLLLYSMEKRNHARSVQFQRSRSLIGATALAVGLYGANLFSTYLSSEDGKTAVAVGGSFQATEVAFVIRF